MWFEDVSDKPTIDADARKIVCAISALATARGNDRVAAKERG